MSICKYCKNEIGEKLKSAHEGKCSVYLEEQRLILDSITKEYLLKEYVENGKSAEHIGRQLGLYSRKIKWKLKEFGIEIRSLQEAKRQKHHIELAKETSNERYGCDFHIAANKEVKQKSLDTLVAKYGVDNIFKTDEMKEKSKQTCLEKFGVEYASQSNEVKTKVADTCIRKYGVSNVRKAPEFIKKMMGTKFKNNKIQSFSSPLSQKFCWEIYKNLPADLQEHCYFAELNKEFGKVGKDGKYYFYDFVITSKNKCIEFNGNYFHMNPELYGEDIFNKKRGLLAEEIWLLDRRKNQFLESLGFNVFVVWEKEFNENKDDVIRKCISFLAHSQTYQRL